MKINNRNISEQEPCYVIAEISHNHQGDEQTALDLVKAAADCGVNAVKFQKRNNNTLFSKDFFDSAYQSENSFGKTYGEHREFLEPKVEWLLKSNQLAHELKLDFIMTVFDFESLEFCEKYLQVDAYKIQSADLTFLQLIEKVMATKKPFFLSCGASSLDEIKAAVHFCISGNADFCLMYAVSSYPTMTKNLNLGRIAYLKKALRFPYVGYSCHYKNNKAAEYARIGGAIAIEKHFTLDKNQKGPDHKFSATPDEMKELVISLSEMDMMKGLPWEDGTEVEPYQMEARFKMGKCVVAHKTLEAGTVLNEDDVIFQSPASGMSPLEMKKYIGKKITVTIQENETILPGHFLE